MAGKLQMILQNSDNVNNWNTVSTFTLRKILQQYNSNKF